MDEPAQADTEEEIKEKVRGPTAQPSTEKRTRTSPTSTRKRGPKKERKKKHRRSSSPISSLRTQMQMKEISPSKLEGKGKKRKIEWNGIHRKAKRQETRTISPARTYGPTEPHHKIPRPDRTEKRQTRRDTQCGRILTATVTDNMNTEDSVRRMIAHTSHPGAMEMKQEARHRVSARDGADVRDHIGGWDGRIAATALSRWSLCMIGRWRDPPVSAQQPGPRPGTGTVAMSRDASRSRARETDERVDTAFGFGCIEHDRTHRSSWNQTRPAGGPRRREPVARWSGPDALMERDRQPPEGSAVRCGGPAKESQERTDARTGVGNPNARNAGLEGR
ncbi:hypothetical protein B0H13DRAFT_1855603 [Mycena leptocephala]|nr:hypothetical protein B0H13DRAFT_1855603 [Mycena leptocephala]